MYICIYTRKYICTESKAHEIIPASISFAAFILKYKTIKEKRKYCSFEIDLPTHIHTHGQGWQYQTRVFFNLTADFDLEV